mmetsp:Transcript_16217/g.32358  ORF Transcript_16217/g.32358 Transcript_16217/m.32358 type:complete len:125 (+) Transcript_16217:29-403(+)
MAGIQFCGECSHMLTPRENMETRSLSFTCRRCGFTEDAEENRIYVNTIVSDTATKLEIVPSDVVADPTLQRSFETQCTACGTNEVVFFQAHGNQKAESLQLIFVCCNRDCGEKWLSELAKPSEA